MEPNIATLTSPIQMATECLGRSASNLGYSRVFVNGKVKTSQDSEAMVQ